jgi:hypothetical protein
LREIALRNTELRALTPYQLKAARLLVQGKSGAETARAVGVRAETVSNWKRAPAFAAELRRLVDLAADGDTQARLHALTPKALDALQAALTDDRPAALHLRLTAAAALLHFAAAIRAPCERGENFTERDEPPA